MDGGLEEKETTAPSSGHRESPDVSTTSPETSAARVAKRDLKMKVKPHTMNVCSKTHTHVVETGARQSPGKLGNLSQTHTPELPGTGRQAGMRGRGREESCSPQIFSFHSDLMCSFWIENTCTGGQGRNQKSATYKKIAFHGHFLSRSHPPPLHFVIGSGACQGGTGSSVP